MPTGSGKSLIAGSVVKSLQLTTLMIVSRHMIRDSLLQRKKELFGDETVSILTSSDYLINHKLFNECDHQKPRELFVLYETTAKERENLAQAIPTEAIVVSIGSDTRYRDAHYEKMTVFPFECNVFSSDSLLDIRDLIIAPEPERRIIIDQIADKKCKQDRLIFAIRTAPYNASPDASKEELDNLREKLKERDREIAEKEEELSVLKSLLVSAGISEEDVKKSIDFIRNIKLQFGDEDSEIINEKVANAIAEQSQKLFARYVTSFSRDYYSSLIEANITNAVWNKMLEESQTCLITAKIAFQSMVKTGDDSLDYSGVCILASKALDIEISKRFFHNYLTYLSRSFTQAKWPYTLLDKDGAVLSDDKFTLGSVKYVVGVDELGNIKNSYVNKCFIQYAKAELYDHSLTTLDIKEHLKNCVQSVETVRNKYRNPAAHRTALSRVTAEECFDYLVDTYKKLKEILEVMK